MTLRYSLRYANLWLFWGVLLAQASFAQPAAEVFGGRATAMGQVNATLRDVWSVFHNPAGLNGAENPTVALAYTNRYNVAAFRSIAAVGTWKLKNWQAGVGISRFGDRLFSEQRLVANMATHLSGVDLGVRVGYLQIATQGLETRGMPFLDLGVITQLTPELRMGASLHHINQPQVATFEDERLPALIRAGLCYQPVERFRFYLETQKETSMPMMAQAGAEYEWHTGFFARTGFSSEPAQGYFGIGGRWKMLQFDYALHTHPRLGFTHQLSIAYTFSPNAAKDAIE